VKRSGPTPILATALFLFLLTGHVCFAAWNLTAPGDPARNWGVSETTAVEYDDNWTAAQRNPESGFRLSSDVKFRASVPLERIIMGINYDYGILYPPVSNLNGVDQNHNLSVSGTYSVNPRLLLSLNENFISSLEPGLVQGPNGAPISLSSGGNYIYDAVSGGMSYELAPRWTLSLSGSWDITRYQVSTVASNNNHEDYAATASALYALDTRTVVGLNYQYTQDIYVNPGLHNGLNGHGNTFYLSAVRRFNPQLSLTLNGGYTIRNSDDGSQDTSPSGSAALTYNYGPSSTLALTIAQSLTEATLGATGSFSAQENSSVALHADHQITVRLHALADASYVYSTFVAPLGSTSGTNTTSTTVKPHEQSATGHIGLSYAFRPWLLAVVDYTYTQVISSDTQVIAPYSRNLASMGITLAY